MSKKKLLILTGGGDCPGLNAVIRGIVKSAKRNGNWDCYGSIEAFNGLFTSPYEIVKLTKSKVGGIHVKGGTILKTTNKGNPLSYPSLDKNGNKVLIDRSEELIKTIKELGFDAAIDYKNENVHKGIKTHCPDRIDVYFDNVGGDILDAALARLNMGARVAICGAISQYNDKAIKGPANYLSLLVNRATMEGFVVIDYQKDYGKASREMSGWLMEGKLKSKEDVYEGIENFNDTFLRLFNGQKMGKLVLKVSD